MQLFGTIDFSQINDSPNAAPDYEDTNTRWSFSTFLRAFISVFVMLTGRWTTIAFYTAEQTSYTAIVMWVSLMAIGNFVMLNLLLAVLIDSIRANADKVERQNSKLAAQARKRDEHRANMKGLCRRLHELGLEGSLLGDYAGRETELYEDESQPPSPLMSPIDETFEKTSSKVCPSGKYDVTESYEEEAEEQDVLFINRSRPGSVAKDEMIEESNPVMKVDITAKEADSIHMLDLALTPPQPGTPVPCLPGTPSSSRPPSARVAPEEDDELSASAQGTGSGTGMLMLAAGEGASSEYGAGIGSSIAGAPKKKKKKKKKEDPNLSVFRFLPFGYLLPCVQRPAKPKPPEKVSTEVDESSVVFDPEEKSLGLYT